MIRLIALLLLISGPALADDMQYRNSRFGTTAILPADFRASAAPTNGDGRGFSHPSLRGTVSVYGSHNISGDRLADHRDYLTELYLESGMTITYQAGGNNWFVLSGWDGDEIYYLRAEGCTGGPVHHIYFSFPGSEKPQWEPIIKRYASKLDGPCRLN